MPKKPPIDEDFDLDDMIEMEDDSEGEEESFEVDGDVIERIAKALETIAKVLVDREAKFASRPPRDNNFKSGFGDRPQRSFGGDRGGDRGGPPRGGDRDGGFENKREFVRPTYGEKTFRNGPGVGFSDRDKPARSGPPRSGGAGAGAGKPYGKPPAGGRPTGARPSTGGPKGPPKPRGKY